MRALLLIILSCFVAVETYASTEDLGYFLGAYNLQLIDRTETGADDCVMGFGLTLGGSFAGTGFGHLSTIGGLGNVYLGQSIVLTGNRTLGIGNNTRDNGFSFGGAIGDFASMQGNNGFWFGNPGVGSNAFNASFSSNLFEPYNLYSGGYIQTNQGTNLALASANFLYEDANGKQWPGTFGSGLTFSGGTVTATGGGGGVTSTYLSSQLGWNGGNGTNVIQGGVTNNGINFTNIPGKALVSVIDQTNLPPVALTNLGPSLTVKSGAIINTNGFANVLDYGAVGNGSTDDTAAIQAALNSLTNGRPAVDYNGTSSGGGVLYFPPGRQYLIGSPPINVSNCVAVSGGLYGGSMIIDNSATLPAFIFTNTPFGSLHDLQILGNGSATGGELVACVYTNTDQKIDFYNDNFYGGYIGVAQTAGAFWVIHNCYFNRQVNAAIYVANQINADQGDWSISDTVCYGNGAGSSFSALLINSSGGGKIVNFKANEYTYGIVIQPSGGSTSLLGISCASIENVNTGIVATPGDSSHYTTFFWNGIEVLMNGSGSSDGIVMNSGIGNYSEITGIVVNNIQSGHYAVNLTSMTSVHCNGIMGNGGAGNFTTSSCSDCPTPTY